VRRVNPPLIRPATRCDTPALVVLIRQAGYPAVEEATIATLDALLDNPSHMVLVAEGDDGAVLGLIALCCRPSLSLGGWVGVVEELVVRPAVRGAGIGARLVQYAKGLAAARGLSRLEVTVPEAHGGRGRQFLFDRGFTESSARTYRWSALEPKHPPLPAAAALA
jgi:GNAT superfamily N-acetyltransferase